MSGKIVAFEGICCSGKTTLVRRLDSQDGFTMIEEYGSYTDSFPAQASTPSELMENTEFFIELESQRYHDSLARGKSCILTVDRSFITCCAYDYAAFKSTSLAPYLPTVEMLWEKENKKLVPDTVFVLGVNEQTFKDRLFCSGKTLTPLLCNHDFNQAFNEYLITASHRWNIDLITIDTNNLSQSQVASKVLELL